MNNILATLKKFGPTATINWLGVIAAVICVLGLMRFLTPEIYALLVTMLSGGVETFSAELPGQ